MSFAVEDLKFNYAEVPVLDGLSFEIKEGEIFCVLGPSGCGKTTLLKLLAGLLAPVSGSIGSGFAGEKSFLFQEPRLLPWMTVEENLRFAMEAHLPEGKFQEAMGFFLNEVRLTDYKHYYPDELSGGMQQRIAIVRAFMHPGKLMLLDEPFKSLDLEIMLSVIETFRTLWATHAKTVVMITHDVMTAALLGDRIAILSEKPTRVVEIVANPVMHDQRRIQSPEVGRFQSGLYEKLLR